MKIGLIDVDGHNYPNLCLMKLSAYHKSIGDIVEWWKEDSHYDFVYMSKVFSDVYSPDILEPNNADIVIISCNIYYMYTCGHNRYMIFTC